MRSRKRTGAGVDRVGSREDDAEAVQWPAAEVPPGSESRACAQRFSRNLGAPIDSSAVRNGDTGTNPRLADEAALGGESEEEAASWYRRAKATKRSGMIEGKSQSPIVPMKPGNSLRGTRRREGAAG
jgi:hypothetical protein